METFNTSHQAESWWILAGTFSYTTPPLPRSPGINRKGKSSLLRAVMRLEHIPLCREAGETESIIFVGCSRQLSMKGV